MTARKITITVLVALAVLGLGAGTASASRTSPERGMCDVLEKLPAYGYAIPGGGWISVPAGRVLLKELDQDGVKGKQRQRACTATVADYAEHN